MQTMNELQQTPEYVVTYQYNVIHSFLNALFKTQHRKVTTVSSTIRMVHACYSESAPDNDIDGIYMYLQQYLQGIYNPEM